MTWEMEAVREDRPETDSNDSKAALPSLWSFDVQPEELFAPQVISIPLTNSSSVQPCGHCQAQGWMRCVKCKMKRTVKCNKCGGSGKIKSRDAASMGRRVRCGGCRGLGKKRCATCGGDGKQNCEKCGGNKRLRKFAKMTATFAVRRDAVRMFEEEAEGFPKYLVGGGDVIFEKTAKRIRPLKKFRAQRINDASDELLRRHKSLPPSDKLLHQRHILISFPIHQVSFELAGKSGIFWLYGRDNEIFFPDYPKKSLLQCDIM